MKKISSLLALAGLFVVSKSPAISLDDISFWTGSGTNRAALVVEWSSPESSAGSSVPAPLTDKTLVWGYRFNGTANGSQMLHAIVAADPRLYVVEDDTYGTFVEGIGYNLNGNGIMGITDGTTTNYFNNGLLTNSTLDVDSVHAINGGDLYWSGYFGPNWETWNELGDQGGFESSPNRGTNQYWTADDPSAPYSGDHGQWELAQNGLDYLTLTNGSWIGFSIAAGEYEPDTNAPYNLHKHAPASPDGLYVTYVCNTKDFASEIVSTNNVYTTSPYNDPLALLGRPTLKFQDYFGDNTTHRTKLIEAPYWTAPDGSNVITEIKSGGQITVKLGRKVYDNPNNPYGVDFIVYGNSFFSASGLSGFVGDDTDLNAIGLSSGFYGHSTVVSVSQDGVNWFTFTNAQSLFPDNAYRWDEPNHAWTDEEMNPTKPLNPSLYTTNFTSESVANALDQFVGAAGGTGFDLKASGLPWIQYVRVEPGPGTYTVIDAIAAVNPVSIGDALSITPDNLTSGITNLVFQNADDLSRNFVSLSFDSVSEAAKVSTANLNDFSAFQPVPGNVSSACQIGLKPLVGTDAVAFEANIGLHVGKNYTGTGSDLRLLQWAGTNWVTRSFTFDTDSDEAIVSSITNVSALVLTQITAPQLNIQPELNGFMFNFTPVMNCQNILERSTDLVTWTPVDSITPTNSEPVTLGDSAPPADKAFYRLRLNVQ